uniref:Uncharacterized protein n=1 Tax=Avena sativa TaxID=4498 RepID=A0ACD5YKA5_AVESA
MASQSSAESKKGSTMDVGGLHEIDESSPSWMSQLFEKFDLEVDEEDLCSTNTDKKTKTDAHSLKKYENTQNWDIASSDDKERSECMHPDAVRALILPWKGEEKQQEPMTDPDDYLSCQTHTPTGTGSTCPQSSRTLPVPHSSTVFRPLIGARYLVSEEEAKEYYSTRRRLTHGRRPHSGMERMVEECLLAFRNYVQNISLEDTEHRFGELLCHCNTIHAQRKIYQHFNFIMETKPSNSDIWTPKLYFAEVKQLSSVKYYFCCPLEASDHGGCYECEKQHLPDDLKHPRGGGYENGYIDNLDLYTGYSESDSDRDVDVVSSSVFEDHWLMYVD